MHHPGCAGSVGLGRLAELWGVGRAAAAPAPCHGQAGQCSVPHGAGMLSTTAGQCCHHVLHRGQGAHCPTGRELLSLGTAFSPHCSGGSRMLEWLYVFSLSWPGQGLAVWFSLSLKHRCQDVPTGRTFALMPTSTKILFLMPFPMGYTCP